MTPDFSPFSYVFNNPVNFIDEFGLMGSGWNTRGREETDAEKANKEQMENPRVQKVEITQNPGSMANVPDYGSKGWYQKAKDFATGFSNGFGQLMHDLAPIRQADENDPKTFAESLNNIKNIPSNLAKLPDQLKNVYQNGNLEEKTQATVQTIGLVFAMAKGKASNPNGLILSKVGVHGNSLKSLKATWGYKLFTQEGKFLKNGITSKLIPEKRYSKSYMLDKFMKAIPFSNRIKAYQWESLENQILRGPLNKNMH
jgi:hypothetical protein